MFTFISWGQYFTTILIFLAFYYLIIAIRYFRADLLQLLQRKKVITGNDRIPAENKSVDDPFATIASLKNALQKLFEQGKQKGWIKEELLMALRSPLQQVQQLKATAFQVAINNYISIEGKHICGIELTDNDIEQLWQ